MRTAILILMTLATAAPADDARERRVKVALALAATCGKCATDEAACRKEAATAGKPLVLFVGESCGRCGDAVREAGGVSCVVERYEGDGRPATEKRAVILSPKPGPAGGWVIEGTVPVGETSVKAAVSKATGAKPAGKALSWDLR